MTSPNMMGVCRSKKYLTCIGIIVFSAGCYIPLLLQFLSAGSPRLTTASRRHNQPPQRLSSTSKNTPATLELESTPTAGNSSQPNWYCSKNCTLTDKLWIFKEMAEQQLYFYESFLKKPWDSNQSNSDILRKELAENDPVLLGNKYVFLHQGNVVIGDVIKYAFEGNKSKTIDEATYNIFQKENPLPGSKLYRSCAVIGNSGILNNSTCGRDIDKNDFVFRCNLAPIKPFAVDAGMKCNFTTMNPTVVIDRYKSLKNKTFIDKFNRDMSTYNGVIRSDCYGFAAYSGIAFKSMKLFNGGRGGGGGKGGGGGEKEGEKGDKRGGGEGEEEDQSTMLSCANPSHIKAVASFWHERKVGRRMSTGFYLVTTAIHMCEEVNLYGFWPFLHRYTAGGVEREVPYHFFDDMPYTAKTKRVHAMDAEFNILAQLHDLGVVRLHVGPC